MVKIKGIRRVKSIAVRTKKWLQGSRYFKKTKLCNLRAKKRTGKRIQKILGDVATELKKSRSR